MGNGINWPARAYIYGTWGYALNRARERATEFEQRMWLYRAVLDGEPVWVVTFDPKRRERINGRTHV